MNEEQIRRIIREELQGLIKSDRYIFAKDIQIQDGRKIQVGKSNGTQIATEATQKLGFFGNTPIVQPVQMPAPTGGATIDQPARDSINVIILRLTQLGLAAA